MNVTISKYDQFYSSFKAVLINELCFDPATANTLSDQVYRYLSDQGPCAYRDIYQLLDVSGVRQRWNATFQNYRAATAAKWILPHVKGRAIDFLCGDGRIGRVLSDFGVPIVLSERQAICESYPSIAGGMTWIAHEEVEAGKHSKSFETGILSTALHHEPDCANLIELAAYTCTQRLIVIENCLEDGLSEDYHIFVDDFFNYCLNETPLPCPAEHRTLDGWIEALKAYANIAFVDRVGRLPGIPLSHHLIVADLKS